MPVELDGAAKLTSGCGFDQLRAEAAPILIDLYHIVALACWFNWRLGIAWCAAGPSALIGASEFLELAVATAIALFGFWSVAAIEGRGDVD